MALNDPFFDPFSLAFAVFPWGTIRPFFLVGRNFFLLSRCGLRRSLFFFFTLLRLALFSKWGRASSGESVRQGPLSRSLAVRGPFTVFSYVPFSRPSARFSTEIELRQSSLFRRQSVIPFFFAFSVRSFFFESRRISVFWSPGRPSFSRRNVIVAFPPLVSFFPELSRPAKGGTFFFSPVVRISSGSSSFFLLVRDSNRFVISSPPPPLSLLLFSTWRYRYLPP